MEIVEFIENHWIAALWIFILFALGIYTLASRIAKKMNLSYKKGLESEERRLEKLSKALSDRESAVSAKEKTLQERESRLESSLRAEKGRQSLAMDFSRSYIDRIQPSLSQISHFLPNCYSPLMRSNCSEKLLKRVYSAVSGGIFIQDSFECAARIHGSSGKTYRTSLVKCTCEDFVYNGGPCKHMLHLLFSILAASPEALQDLERSVQMESEIKKGYMEQIRTEKSAKTRMEKKYETLERKVADLQAEADRHEANLHQLFDSNLTAIPWLAGMMADYLTYDLEVEARKLEWGRNIQREKKVASIRDIRADARARIQEAKEALYQLEYLRSLYPALDDVLDTDFKQLDFSGKIPEYDPIRDYLSKEEWEKLSSVEKDQLALDRYVESRNKSKWQIGRDYELSVAYEYMQKGYHVDTFGNYMGVEDLGRDLIVQNAERTIIIQCKYWSKTKTIHEKHIFQLYGTVITYQIENQNILNNSIHGVFVTNTVLSSKAHQVADMLGITVVENHEMSKFPRIKCNIGHNEEGETHIYHLPMDAQYDVTQIKAPGEFYAFTVQEAIDAGFRRAYKWHGNSQ